MESFFCCLFSFGIVMFIVPRSLSLYLGNILLCFYWKHLLCLWKKSSPYMPRIHRWGVFMVPQIPPMFFSWIHLKIYHWPWANGLIILPGFQALTFYPPHDQSVLLGRLSTELCIRWLEPFVSIIISFCLCFRNFLSFYWILFSCFELTSFDSAVCFCALGVHACLWVVWTYL